MQLDKFERINYAHLVLVLPTHMEHIYFLLRPSSFAFVYIVLLLLLAGDLESASVVQFHVPLTGSSRCD